MQIDLLNWLKKYFFKEISKEFIKNDFELVISIYLLTKRISLFSQFHLYLILKKKSFTLIISKEFITKFQFDSKNYFYLLLLENNEFLQFYLQKYFD